MRRAMRVLVAAVLTGLLAWPATTAGAAPLPRDTSSTGEWWFVAWDIAKIWGMGAQGQGVTVAVLDSGVNPAIAGLSSVLGPGTDVTNGGNGDGRTDTDDTGHGTRMAAFIAGQSTEIGVAPRARLLPVVVNSDTAGDNATFYANGIRWALDHGAQVINISQGTDGAGQPGNCPPVLQGAVKDAVGRGAVVVASAGNDGAGTNPAYFPAACKGVLSVGAIDLAAHVWSGTERQSYVDVAAPGVRMHAIDAKGQEGTSNGTSDAAALTSGAIALIWSKYPQLTNRQVVARLLATLRDDASHPGRDTAAGGGIVRPYRAIVDNVPAGAPNAVFDELDTLPPGPPPGGGPPPPGGAGPTCVQQPAAGDGQARVSGPPPGPPGGGPPGGSAPPPPPPCTAAATGGGSSTGIPLLPVVIGVVGVILLVVAFAVFAGRRRGSSVPAGFPPQQPIPPQQPGNPPYQQGNQPYQHGPPQQGPPPGWGSGG